MSDFEILLQLCETAPILSLIMPATFRLLLKKGRISFLINLDTVYNKRAISLL